MHQITLLAICLAALCYRSYADVDEPGADLNNLVNGKASIINIMDISTWAVGVVSVEDEIYIINNWESDIKVYDADSFNEVRSIPVSGLEIPSDMVYSELSNCLYVCDNKHHKIHEVQLDNTGSVRNWDVKEFPLALSVSSDGSIYLICHLNDQHIYEYSTDGTLLRAINLETSIDWPWHAILLTSGNFAVSHGSYDMKNRVVIVNSKGEIVNSAGDDWGSSLNQFRNPHYMVKSRDGSILVADLGNYRIMLYDGQLEHKGEVVLPGVNLFQPIKIHIDETNRRLYIGEMARKRVIVVGY